MELSMPVLKWEPMKVLSHIRDMDSTDFWQQKGIQCAKKGQIDAALDYYRQGLRQFPTSHILIYSLATCYSQQKKYNSAIHWYGKGIDLDPRWVDGLCGIAINYFNMLNFDRALYFIQLAKDNSKGEKLKNCLFQFEYIAFIYTTCLKMTAHHSEASKSYINLDANF